MTLFVYLIFDNFTFFKTLIMFLKLQSNNNNNSYQDDTGINGQCFFFEKDRTLKPMNIVVENRHRVEKKLHICLCD